MWTFFKKKNPFPNFLLTNVAGYVCLVDHSGSTAFTYLFPVLDLFGSCPTTHSAMAIGTNAPLRFVCSTRVLAFKGDPHNPAVNFEGYATYLL